MLANIYFNSIKVQLKQDIFAYAPYCRVFQFHKGTIKTSDAFYSQTAYKGFQFHKGTIKTTKLKKNGIRQILFQFHKGTIKTNTVNIKRRKTSISIP